MISSRHVILICGINANLTNERTVHLTRKVGKLHESCIGRFSMRIGLAMTTTILDTL